MNYKDFDIEISGKQGDEFDVKFSSGASGEERIKVSLNRTVDELLDALEGRVIAARGASAARTVTPVQDGVAAPDDDEVGEEVGQYLFDVLFSHRSSSLMLAESMKAAEGTGSGIRLRLTLNTGDPGVADLARLPWELLYGGEKYKYFARQLGSPIVRYLEVQEKSAVRQLYPPLRIMVVSANPRRDLALDKERDNLKQALSDAVRKERIELTFVENASIKAVADALARGRLAGRNFHVLHYMGHGDFHSGRGVLLMHKESGGEDLVDADAFSEALKASEDLRLVFLNACNTAQSSALKGSSPFGGVATALVRQGVPAVVAMQRPVPDSLAIALAKSFYPNLAEGVPVDAAMSEGRRQMYFEDRNSLDWAIPVLFMRSPDGALFDFAKAAEKLVVVPDPPGPPRPVEPPFRPAHESDQPQHNKRPQGWTWKGWAVTAVGVSALLAATYAAYTLLGGPGKPSALLRQPSTSSLELETGKDVVLQLELLDDERNVVRGQALAKYPVDWKASSNNVTITAIAIGDNSKTIGATVRGTTPGTTAVTIAAAFLDFPDLKDGEWKLTVVPSEQAKDEFVAAFRDAQARFDDATVDDTAVAGTYQKLLADFPWAVEYLDAMKALNATEKAQVTGINEKATGLAKLAAAFSDADGKGKSTEYTLKEREKIWSDYVTAWAKVRDGSSYLKTAQSYLAELGKAGTTAASVTALETCTLGYLSTESPRKCRRPTTEFRANDDVALAVQWTTPPTMATSTDRLVFEFGPVGTNGQLASRSQVSSDSEGRRPEVRSWWGNFRAGAAGSYEIRVKNGRGDFVWRHPVKVQ